MILLVRHAEHDLLGRALAGRMAGVGLNALGRAQAERLARLDVAAIQSSPLERARETALPLARRLGLPVETVDALNEIDFGVWQGRSFAELDADPVWHDWNRDRARTRPPGGESMTEVQARIVGHLRRLTAAPRPVVLFSHGDVIKAALLHVLGLPLDAVSRIEVDPAGISTVALGEWGAKLVALNERIVS
ncbi:MAG: histidine phosphatase family protein [Alphaproteobacteria bacterium]|nr:histidine phosphatase family protein [Alphaproteobacteria bacterium]